jgi:hypothetical protein
MNNIEVVIFVILPMAVPEFCRKLGRPGLVFSVFVRFGLKFARPTQPPFSQEGGVLCA